MTTEIDDKLKSYKKIQTDIQTLYGQKQQILSQYNENTLVKGELDLLNDENTVYKLVGPLLMSVDLEDARQNVSKRLEFIEGEIKKVDNSIAAKQKEQGALGDEIASIQQKMQADAAAAARSVTEPKN